MNSRHAKLKDYFLVVNKIFARRVMQIFLLSIKAEIFPRYKEKRKGGDEASGAFASPPLQTTSDSAAAMNNNRKKVKLKYH